MSLFQALNLVAPCTFSLALFSPPHFYSLSTKCGAQTHGAFSARVHFCGHVFSQRTTVPTHSCTCFRFSAHPHAVNPPFGKLSTIHSESICLCYYFHKLRLYRLQFPKQKKKKFKHYTAPSKIPNLLSLSQVRH